MPPKATLHYLGPGLTDKLIRGVRLRIFNDFRESDSAYSMSRGVRLLVFKENKESDSAYEYGESVILLVR